MFRLNNLPVFITQHAWLRYRQRFVATASPQDILALLEHCRPAFKRERRLFARDRALKLLVYEALGAIFPIKPRQNGLGMDIVTVLRLDFSHGRQY